MKSLWLNLLKQDAAQENRKHSFCTGREGGYSGAEHIHGCSQPGRFVSAPCREAVTQLSGYSATALGEPSGY